MCERLTVIGGFKRKGGEWFAGLVAPIELLEAGNQLGVLAFKHLDVAVRR